MATTTNYSWTTPDDTALVKDGAAAIRSLGTAIDSTVFTNAGAAINKTIVDAKGDLIVATAADTVARLASSGVNGQVLQVDTSTATGLKYGDVASGSNWSLLNAGGTALTGAATVTVSGISGKDKIMVLITEASSNTSSNALLVRFNTDTGNNYYNYGFKSDLRGTYDAGTQSALWSGVNNSIWLGEMGVASAQASGFVLLSGCNSTGVKVYNAGGGSTYGGSQSTQQSLGGYYNSASTISSVSLFTGGGNWDNGTVFIYTSA
jgi:hypothetical protein